MAGSLPPVIRMIPDKAVLRRQLRQARASIKPRQRRLAAAAFTRNAIRSGLLLRFRRIAFYIPMPTELDLRPLLNEALWRRRECWLPVVPQGRGKRMRFTQVHPDNGWYLNRYRIPEVAARRSLPARALDLMFVPLVGFDPYGNRLGMGGGYYDGTLAFLRRRKAWRRPLLVGAAFECQKVAQLPADPWDQPLDWVITESRVYRCKRRRQ